MKYKITILIESVKLSANHYDDILSYESYLVPCVGDKIKINDDIFLVLERILPTTDNKILLIGELVKL